MTRGKLSQQTFSAQGKTAIVTVDGNEVCVV